MARPKPTKRPKTPHSNEKFKVDLSKARALLNQGEFSKAYTAYKRLSRSHSSSFAVQMGLASVLFELGRTKEAESALKRAVKLRSSPRAWFKLGNARKRLGNSAGAKAAYRKALSINPNYGPATRALARMK